MAPLLKKSRVISLAAGPALLAALALGGCSSNDGGSTTCGEYLKLGSGDRTEVIKKYLADQGNEDAGSIKVGLAKASVLAYCKTAGSDSDPISGIGG